MVKQVKQVSQHRASQGTCQLQEGYLEALSWSYLTMEYFFFSPQESSLGTNILKESHFGNHDLVQPIGPVGLTDHQNHRITYILTSHPSSSLPTVAEMWPVAFLSRSFSHTFTPTETWAKVRGAGPTQYSEDRLVPGRRDLETSYL